MTQQVIECATTCTVTLLLASAPPDSDRLGDMAELAGYFFVAALTIFLLRKLFDLFDRAPHAD